MVTDVRITRVVTDDAILLGLAGELDLANADQCGADLAAAVAAAPPPHLVLLDLRELDFLAAAGVRALLSFADDCAQRGLRAALVLDGASNVQRLVRLLGLDRRLPVYSSTWEASASTGP